MNKYHIMSSLFHVLPPIPNQPVSPSVVTTRLPEKFCFGLFSVYRSAAQHPFAVTNAVNMYVAVFLSLLYLGLFA